MIFKSKNTLNILKNRLSKIQVEVEFKINYPWVYIDSINGIKVKERHFSKHGYTIAFLPTKLGDNLKFVNISGIFKLIKEYKVIDLKNK
jgi:hypothetical protein